MATRVPVESGVRAEALQTVAMPRAQAVTARLDPGSSQAFQLATALGANAPVIDRMFTEQQSREREAAATYAAGMTPDQLRKKIDSGELPMWKSPLWTAVVQHTAGDNTVKSIFRDVDSQIAQGKFSTQAEVDDYIKQKRDEALSGKSSYEVAGFDKNFNQYRERAAGQQNGVITERLRNEAAQVVTENLSNAVSEITGPSFEGKTPQDKVKHVLKLYDLHRNAQTLTDDAARSTLDSAVFKLAASGNVELVNEFLKTKLPNNGPSIETFLDVKNGQSTGRSVQLRNTAETQFNQNNRESAQRLLQAQQDVIIQSASAQADELVATRSGPNMPDIMVPTANGGTKTIKGSDLVEGALQRQIAANPNMEFGEQVRLYSNNGVINQQWKKEFSTAVYNLGEITIDAEGKPVGTLLKSTIDQLEKFKLAENVSEQYTKDLVGEDNYKMLYKIRALQDPSNGGLELNQAAGLVNQINRRQYDQKTWGNLQKDVNTEIESIKNPDFFSRRNFSELFRGEFGEGEKNLLPIESGVRELAETLMQARVSPNAKEAVKRASEYMANSVVQVNNTLYMKADIPKAPAGEDAISWFEKYQTEVLLPQLKAMGLNPRLSDLTLLPQKGVQPSFIVANKGMPLPGRTGIGNFPVTHAEIETWTKTQINIRQTNQSNEANKGLAPKQKDPQKPPMFETPGGAVFIGPRVKSKRSE